MNHSGPTVTIILPVLNEARHIRETLAAVLNQDYPPDCLEILVVDGDSTDGTQEMAREMLEGHPLGGLLYNPRRIQAAALNIGIAAAQGEIIVRVDGHTVIAPDYVRKCVEYLTGGKAEGVGGLMHPRGTTYAGLAIALAFQSIFGMGDSKFHYSEREQYVDTVYLGAYWRATLKKIGLYDETLSINEDYELNYRLRQSGGRILLSPTIRSIYIPRSSLLALWRQYFKYGRWKVRMLQKHPESLRWRQTIPPLFVGGFAGSLGLGLFLPLFRRLFFLLTPSYLLANLLASTIAAKRGGWRYWPVLPLVFATIHFAWGTGFLVGLGLALFSSKRRYGQGPK